MVLTLVVATPSLATTLADAATTPTTVALPAPTPGGHCPWVEQSRLHEASAATLAGEVLSRMTLAQKAAFVVLATRPPLENTNSAVAALCLPALTLIDGPNGVANGLAGVTQFPAAIGIGATFSPTVARSVARAIASEARTKGVAVVQGPDLNLARVPLSGRTFDTYGEDPWLTSVLGVAAIEGIQSTGEMANAKHFTAYTQETARGRLDQVVPLRALSELYNRPFQAAVQRAHVASLMCSYGLLNGVYTCADPYIYGTLKSWGFTGFVRSDLEAVKKVAPAFRAGLSMIKPASPRSLVRLVRRGTIPLADLNRAVRSVLTPMFKFGLIAHPLFSDPAALATTPAHVATALRAAETSVVLLKNAGAILPLSAHVSSIALIGTPASSSPVSSGSGSSKVMTPDVVTPLAALQASLGPRVHLTYASGGPSTLDFDQLSDVDILRGTPLKLVQPTKPVGEVGKTDIAIDREPNVTQTLATAAHPGNGPGWVRWSVEVRARHTGTYQISLQQIGDTWLYVNQHLLAASMGLHARTDLSATVAFVAGHRYTFSARWFQVRRHRAPSFSILDVTPQINAAVAMARRAQVAIVFAGDVNTEGADRSSMNLPGDANALITAVAKANPHTIVVLNTGGAVLMPWLSSVAGVVEAWYPGQTDGTAIAAVLDGTVNPSGRLPITFPRSASAMPAATYQQFPGVRSRVTFGGGLDLGYRWYELHHVRPLFPFGFGLSYTSFRVTNPTLRSSSTGVVVRVSVTNRGRRTGTDVVQAYVTYPPGAGEPPVQLRAFARVHLAPAKSARVALVIPSSGFQIFQNRAFTTVPGVYGIEIGQSSMALALHLSVRR